jgi:hypothetical protein
MARWTEAAAFFDDQGLRIFDLWRAVGVGAQAREDDVRSQLQHTGQDRPCRLRAWVGVPARVLSLLRSAERHPILPVVGVSRAADQKLKGKHE